MKTFENAANLFSSFLVLLFCGLVHGQSYKVVDTGQSQCFDNNIIIAAPDSGTAFFGQDAQYSGFQPAYQDNGDGTITDLITGLIWQKMLPDAKYDYGECVMFADTSTYAGYTDWRLPTIKELYSLILFSGITGMDEQSSVPYIDTNYFDFRFGGTVIPSERFIDAQYATNTIYRGTTMGDNETMFGVNFVDGRIKGYPTSKDFEIRLIRGRTDYGINAFIENSDSTISDFATGLMWDQTGISIGMDWETALAWVTARNTELYRGYSDWRLPNIKELHSIVDYDRSPSFTNSPAIAEVFFVPMISDEDGNDNFPFYWASTTHFDGPAPNKATYVCFGEALGFMQVPPNSGNYVLQDVHGAGAQRSDPKAGDPNDYPYGHGPQGDVIRIYNYVRVVRNLEVEIGTKDWFGNDDQPQKFWLDQNHPNPFNPTTTIKYELPQRSIVQITIYDLLGGKVTTLVSEKQSAGNKSVIWNATNNRGQLVSAGVYFYQIRVQDPNAIGAGDLVQTRKMILIK